MATHSSVLAWRIPRTEEPGRLQPMGLLRVRHNWATSLSLFTFMHWRRNGNPLQYSCLDNSMSRGTWQAAVHEAAKSWIQSPNLSLPTPYPLVTISLYSIKVTLFLSCRGVHLYLSFFLDSIYMWYHVLVFLCLTYFTQYGNLWVHPCCCRWHYFILFHGWLVFHHLYGPHLHAHSFFFFPPF